MTQEPWQELGISPEKMLEIALMIEHLNVDFRLSAMNEIEYAKKLFPKMSPEDLVKVIYFGRIQYWAGRNFRNSEK